MWKTLIRKKPKLTFVATFGDLGIIKPTRDLDPEGAAVMTAALEQAVKSGYPTKAQQREVVDFDKSIEEARSANDQDRVNALVAAKDGLSVESAEGIALRTYFIWLAVELVHSVKTGKRRFANTQEVLACQDRSLVYVLRFLEQIVNDKR